MSREKVRGEFKMAKITKITTQKRKGRYNIYLDGKYAFGVAENVLVHFQLMKGMEVDDDLKHRLENADQVARGYSRMLDYLAHQLRTEREVRLKLKQIETPAEFVDPVIERLKDERLIDDQVYADSYVRTVMRTDLKGPGVIRRHLLEKGVSDDKIEQALTQFTDELQLENATKLAKKLYRRYRAQPDRRRNQKVYQGLMTKGYGSTICQQAQEAIAPEPDPDRQYELMVAELRKVWHRNRRYDRKQRELRTKRTMYTKGFDLDAVSQWIEEQD